MNSFFTGTIILLHGLVHSWFVVLAAGWVNFKPDMGWSGESWILSGLLSTAALKITASFLYSLSGLLFVAGAFGIYVTALWRTQFLLAAAILSSLTIFLFFDGNSQMLVQKGLFGILINLFILFCILIFR